MGSFSKIKLLEKKNIKKNHSIILYVAMLLLCCYVIVMLLCYCYVVMLLLYFGGLRKPVPKLKTHATVLLQFLLSPVIFSA